MQIRLFTPLSLPKKYKLEIINTDLCSRNNVMGVNKEWIDRQLNRAEGGVDFIIVCLNEKKIVGFILAEARHKPDDGERRKKHTWMLDTICRKQGSEYSMVAQLLLNRLITEALKYNVRKINLYATTSHAANAYKRLGFVTTGFEDDGENMCLRLY